MNSNIDFNYDTILYGNFDKIIKKIINNFKNKQLLLDNKKYEKLIEIKFIKLIDNNYCEMCNKYADYYGFCIEHYEQEKIDKYRKDFIDYISINIDDNNIINLCNDYFNQHHKLTLEYNRNITWIQQHYFKYIYPLLNFKVQNNGKINNKKYINNIYNINYDELNVIFDDENAYDIIYNFNNKMLKCTQNFIIFFIFLLKKYTYDNNKLKMLYKNPKENIDKITFIGNNNILYNKIYNSTLINYIEYMETEKPIHINNTTLRIDLYIIVNSYNVEDCTNNLFEIYIECDEKQHYSKNNYNYDIMKDNYCIENNISLLRLEIKNNKISENEINFCIFFINYLIKK